MLLSGSVFHRERRRDGIWRAALTVGYTPPTAPEEVRLRTHEARGTGGAQPASCQIVGGEPRGSRQTHAGTVPHPGALKGGGVGVLWKIALMILLAVVLTRSNLGMLWTFVAILLILLLYELLLLVWCWWDPGWCSWGPGGSLLYDLLRLVWQR